MFVPDKGSARFDLTDKVAFVVPICFAVGFGCGLVWVFIFGPCAKVRIEQKMQREAEAKTQQVEVVDLEDVQEQPAVTVGAHQDYDEVMVDDDVDAVKKPTKTVSLPPAAVTKTPTKPEQVAMLTNGDVAPPPANESLYGQFARNTFNQDLHAQSMHENAQAAQIWDNGKEYDPYAESLFNYIQVFTACLNSFAHGANDVSNTIAPLSAIIYIYQNGKTQSKSQVDMWVLAFGGGAIVIGLLL
jgi:phosphate/sulfate permease